MSETRKCEVKRDYEASTPGVFHQWGSKLQYGDGEKLFPVTFGIVELENGQVEEVRPERIKFLK